MRLLFIRLKWTGFSVGMLLGLLLLATSANAAADNYVAAQGLVMPKGGLVHVAAPAGQTGQAIVQELKVKEGDLVTAGQLIATLSSRAAAEADLSAAELDADAAAKAPAIIQAQIDAIASQVAAAQAEADAASSQLAVVQATIAQAQAGVVQAQKGKREALDKLDAAQAKITGTNAAYQNTLDELDPPRRETEEIKFKQKLLSEELRELSASRSATVARIDADIAAAEAAVAVAQAQVDATAAQAKSAQENIATIEAQRAVLEAELARAQAAASAAQGGVAKAKVQLAMTEVHSPSAGVVLHLGARPGEAVGPVGVVIIGDLTELFIEAEVYIDDVRKVKTGQKVTVKSDAFTGELMGEVTEVGQLVNPQGVFSSDPLAYSDKRVVLVRIKVSPVQGWAPPVHAQVIARINVQSTGK